MRTDGLGIGLGMGRGCVALAAVLVAALLATPARSQPLERELVLGGLNFPSWVAAPEGDDRLFISQLNGVIRIYENGQLLPTPFVDLSSTVAFGGGELGLQKFVFDPDFANNGRVFVQYSENPGGSGLRSTFASYTLSSDYTLNPNSRQVIISFTHPHNTHFGGLIGIGPDGYLYIATGDGGHAFDNGAGHTANIGNAQDLTDNPHGKILRLDISGDDFPEYDNYNYKIPTDNPFVNGGGDPEIYAYGLRNPFRSVFDPLTGDLYLADVGQNTREEVNFIPAGSPGGQNFGWRKFEGTGLSGISVNPDLNINNTVLPVIEYLHAETRRGSASITGGVVYRGSELPDWYGYYFFADWVNGDVWAVNTQDIALGQTIQQQDFIRFDALSLGNDSIVALTTGGDGELYIVDITGSLYKITALPALYGDANNDGVVDNKDFLAVRDNFGAIGAANGWLPGDANQDGRVDGNDWLAIERAFGAGAGVVPEPATAALLLAPLLAIRRRR